MRNQRINKTRIYYAQPEPLTPILDEDGFETGEYTHGYSEPKPFKIMVSSATGHVARELFGDLESYHKIMITHDMKVNIKEETLLWIDNKDPTKPYDYVVKLVSESLNSKAFAIKKVDVNG